MICVLALLVLKLLERTARDAGLTLSPAELKTELEDIQEIYLEMTPATIQQILITRFHGSTATFHPVWSRSSYPSGFGCTLTLSKRLERTWAKAFPDLFEVIGEIPVIHYLRKAREHNSS